MLSLLSEYLCLFVVLQVRFAKAAKAITPGQALVLYDGDVCLGSARLLYPGPTLFEYGRDAADRKVVKERGTCTLRVQVERCDDYLGT